LLAAIEISTIQNSKSSTVQQCASGAMRVSGVERGGEVDRGGAMHDGRTE